MAEAIALRDDASAYIEAGLAAAKAQAAAADRRARQAEARAQAAEQSAAEARRKAAAASAGSRRIKQRMYGLPRSATDDEIMAAEAVARDR